MEKAARKNRREKLLTARKGKFYTVGEEIFNSVSHGAGAALAIAGAAVLMAVAAFTFDPFKIASAALYSFCLIVMYTMSTLYHSIVNKTAKNVMRIFDHTSIFLLIAGTYTPYTLVTLRNSGYWGWSIFGVVWGCAILGIVFNAISIEKFKVFSMIAYLAMGWCVLSAILPLIKALAPGGLILLFIGGAFYTLGITFFALTKIKFMHAIWHLFVLTGSITHFFSILFYVM